MLSNHKTLEISEGYSIASVIFYPEVGLEFCCSQNKACSLAFRMLG
jgi:hypothetical protein